ncbi:MAG: hypothetical protein ACI8ZN_000021 [Bacteroidia bacterium]|jgi:hypothetical protein
MAKRLLNLILCFFLTASIAASAPTKVGDEDDKFGVESSITGNIKLGQNYPNPAIGKTYIEVSFDGQEARFAVYNIVGKLIEERVITDNTIVLDVSNYNEGIYLYTIEANGEKVTKRMTVKKP